MDEEMADIIMGTRGGKNLRQLDLGLNKAATRSWEASQFLPTGCKLMGEGLTPPPPTPTPPATPPCMEGEGEGKEREGDCMSISSEEEEDMEEGGGKGGDIQSQ
jgi:hypothetical protein